MDIVFLIARILFAFIFVMSSIGHLTQSKAMAQYAEYKGAPGGRFGVIVTGLMMLVGSISVVLGLWGDLGSLLIALALLPMTFFMHQHWKETDAQAKQGEMINFNKNLGLIGGALALFLLFASQGAAMGLTITDAVITLG